MQAAPRVGRAATFALQAFALGTTVFSLVLVGLGIFCWARGLAWTRAVLPLGVAGVLLATQPALFLRARRERARIEQAQERSWPRLPSESEPS